jgi:hypothetical protein
LKKFRKKAIRMVSGLKSQSYEGRLEVLGMPTLEERRHQLDMAQVIKILSVHDSVERNQWFTMAASGTVNTRQASGPRNLVKPRSNLEVRTNFFSIRVVEDWNAIPADIKMAKNTLQFKKMYRTHRCSRKGPEGARME